MTTVPAPTNPEHAPRVAAVFDDIRATRNTEFINNFWRYLAFDPALLEEVWRDVKRVMAQPSALDAKTKEMIYVAVSIANACSYCTHSHTASARAHGMTEAEYADLIRVVSMAGRTNHLANALYVPLDPVFDKNA